MGIGDIRRGKGDRGLNLATLFHVVQRLRSGTLPPRPNVPAWRAKEHLTCTRKTLERAEKVR